MGSKALHRGGAAQSKPENSTATEVNGQHKSQNRTGCPKVEQKTSREGSHWAAKSSTAAELPKTSRKCTSQQKVDTFFIFYTLKTEHSTPYIVLVSNSLMSMQVFLH